MLTGPVPANHIDAVLLQNSRFARLELSGLRYWLGEVVLPIFESGRQIITVVSWPRLPADHT